MIRIRVPGTLAYRDVVVRTVAAACNMASHRLVRDAGMLDLTTEFDAQVVSAFSEAFNNICLHAYGNGSGGGDVDIEIELTPDYLEMRLVDEGAAFDLNQVPPPDLDAMPEGGLGVFIIQSFIDEFSYDAGPPNVWVLRKYMPSASARATNSEAP